MATLLSHAHTRQQRLYKLVGLPHLKYSLNNDSSPYLTTQLVRKAYSVPVLDFEQDLITSADLSVKANTAVEKWIPGVILGLISGTVISSLPLAFHLISPMVGLTLLTFVIGFYLTAVLLLGTKVFDSLLHA